MSSESIKVPEFTKEAVKALKKYKFRYGKYKTAETAIAIVGGDGSFPNHLRVYVYGGLIGRIGLNSMTQCKIEGFKKDKVKEDQAKLDEVKEDRKYSYGKYLKDKYLNGNKQEFTYEQIPKFTELRSKLIKELKLEEDKDLGDCFDKIAKAFAAQDKNQKTQYLTDPDNHYYLDLISAAAHTRFMHRIVEGEDTKIVSYSERSMQTLITAFNQVIEFNFQRPVTKQSVVVDMEYEAILNNDDEFCINNGYEILKQKNAEGVEQKKEKAKIDLVVFNGVSFGLIEFKYQGESMDKGSNNSLEAHFKDFRRIIHEDTNENKLKLLKELIKRTKYLIAAGVIHQSWEIGIKQIEKILDKSDKEIDVKPYLWCGFLFLGSGNKDIMYEMNSQIGTHLEDGVDVYFQYVEQKPDEPEPIPIKMEKYKKRDFSTPQK